MDRKGRDARLAVLAGRQGAAFSLGQAIALGFPESTVHHRVRRGLWERHLPGTYVLGGSERTRLQDLWVAVLAVGPHAVITHESGALCHGAERLPLDPITLTVPHRWHQRLDGLFAHQIDDLRPSHRTTWHGLPIARPARCVVELAATQDTTTIGRVADDLVRLRRTTYAQIAQVFAEVARPGKPGMARMAEVLDARSDGYVPPASELERVLFAVLDAGGLPSPLRQVPLPGRGLVTGIADAAYRDAGIVLEVDGRRWHARVEAARRDRQRDAQVVCAGWVTLRFVWEQVVHDPDEVCRVVRSARDARLGTHPRAA